MLCVVTKEFLGGGEEYVRNQLVDGSLFRNEQVLISQRFLRPATDAEIKSARYESDEPVSVPKKKTGGLKARIAKRH